jgi:hypothetical protein
MVRFAYTEEFDTEFIRWTGNLFRSFLREKSIQIVSKDESPDFILASIWRSHEFSEKAPTILISNENWAVFKPHHDLSRYLAVLGILPPPVELGVPKTFIQYPFEAVYYDCSVEELYALREEYLKAPRDKFCCFVTSNRYFGEMKATREAVFRRVNEWQRVDSAGHELNNTGYVAPRGIEFLQWISQYRFMICLENSKTPGYITEKALQAWVAGAIPIYDGGTLERLNHGAFVSAAGDYLKELQDLEESRLLFQQKQREVLYREPPSLTSFEEQFRALLRL